MHFHKHHSFEFNLIYSFLLRDINSLSILSFFFNHSQAKMMARKAAAKAKIPATILDPDSMYWDWPAGSASTVTVIPASSSEGSQVFSSAKNLFSRILEDTLLPEKSEESNE